MNGAVIRDVIVSALATGAVLGDEMSFQSITAYRRFGTHDYTDNDGGDRADLYLATLDAKVAHNWQQEFKLSGRDARLDWIAGAYIITATIDTLSQFAGWPN